MGAVITITVLFLIIIDQLGFFQKPERFLFCFARLECKNALTALLINVEGKQNHVINDRLPYSQFFRRLYIFEGNVAEFPAGQDQ